MLVKSKTATVCAVLLLIACATLTYLLFGTSDKGLIFLSGILLVFYFYFPLYIRDRRSTIHLVKSLLLPIAGIAICLSVILEDYTFVLSRVPGVIWLYSAIGTTYWGAKTKPDLKPYNVFFLFYQIGILVFSTSLIISGYSIEGSGVTIPDATKLGALMYTAKILNSYTYIRANRDMPLIVLSFFTPIASVGLFLFI
jgi:hypothetical protein